MTKWTANLKEISHWWMNLLAVIDNSFGITYKLLLIFLYSASEKIVFLTGDISYLAKGKCLFF